MKREPVGDTCCHQLQNKMCHRLLRVCSLSFFCVYPLKVSNCNRLSFCFRKQKKSKKGLSQDFMKDSIDVTETGTEMIPYCGVTETCIHSYVFDS